MMGEFGITRVANVTGLDRFGIPVVMVVRPNSRSVAVSQGKGLDLDAAKASGLMEAIETWHAERMTHSLKLASYRELVSECPVVDVDALPLVEDSLFHADLPMLWVEGHNLFDGAPLWLPYEMVHSNYTIPRPTGHGCFPASTNGLASGNHPLEATCHAVCEVIERDSTTLWHHLSPHQRAATRIDPQTIDDLDCRYILDRLEAAGLHVVIWTTTTDLAVPSFYCLLLDDEPQNGHMGAGAGCHPARHIALSRALTEAVQTRTTYIAGSRDDLTMQEFSATGRQAKYDYARHMTAAGGELADYGHVPTVTANILEADLQFLLERLSACGIRQVVAVNLTKPALELPVMRVVIPGLEAPHDEDDYVPGPRARALRQAGR